ncbi:bifunctional NUDIX hydrolase/histidine phosphatase family protein [Microbispora sp. NPDC049125]|uniref:bifunctional NUDIX hydrolase/histidine phosphatase family protein n=1 Tax=Microbispora sp. NPDC049125 TaxID=3154929 RepID=UPI0034674883
MSDDKNDDDRDDMEAAMAEEPLCAPDFIRAAGAVVWRGDSEAPEIALVHRPKYNDWTLPKGKIVHGEHPVAAAVREVYEETGLRVTLGRWLRSVHYEKKGWAKRVDYWAAQAAGPADFVENEEVDRMSWLPLEAARTALTFERDIAVLTDFAAGPVATTPIAFVRHGQMSGSGDDWRGKKKMRPLDHVGMLQAESLAGVLAAYRAGNLVSAPSERCTQTLEPYRSANRLTVRQDKLFTKKHYEPAGALRVVLGAMAVREPTAICGYRESLEGVLAEMCKGRYDGEAALHLFKGSLVVLHHAAERIVGLERYIL